MNWDLRMGRLWYGNKSQRKRHKVAGGRRYCGGQHEVNVTGLSRRDSHKRRQTDELNVIVGELEKFP